MHPQGTFKSAEGLRRTHLSSAKGPAYPAPAFIIWERLLSAAAARDSTIPGMAALFETEAPAEAALLLLCWASARIAVPGLAGATFSGFEADEDFFVALELLRRTCNPSGVATLRTCLASLLM